MPFYVKRITSEDELAHKDDERENHKYVARVKITKISPSNKNNYRYFYSNEAYQAYLKSRKESDTQNSDKSNLSSLLTENNFFKNVKEKLSKVSKNIKTDLKELISKGKDAVEKAVKKIQNIKDISEENVKKGKRVVDEIITDKANQKVTVKFDESKNKDEKNKRDTELVVDTSREDRIRDDWKNDDTMKVRATPKRTSENSKFMDLNIKTEELPPLADQRLTNPNYDPTNYAYSYNCSYCTTAYDMRRRGYDVEAAPIKKTDDTPTYREVTSWYEGAVLRTSRDLIDDYNLKTNSSGQVKVSDVTKAMEREMVNYGEGARGHLCLAWSNGGGHDVIWEVEHGKVVIRDCQINKTGDLYDYLQRCRNANYFRSDNLEFSDEARRVVVNRKQ